MCAPTVGPVCSIQMMTPQITEYLIDILGDGIYYDEANPKYRCLWNRFHSVRMTKLIVVLHICIYALSIFCRLPYSIAWVPVTLLVFVPAVYGIRNEKAVFLFPLLSYLVFCTMLCIMLALSVFAVCVIDYDTFLIFIGRTDIKTFAGKIGLVLFTKVIIILAAIFLFWQSRVVSACRQFYHDKMEHNQYLHTAIPDDLPAAGEKPPIETPYKLTPEYLPFTLQ
ncbi:hypothetical protein Tcan_05608 [Toxocara canis]|uniref:Uncharacterized protein n=1 Tax=Toxocara canis TaxID=6265 RepID=A0A0B2V2P5_TOXCA|nr:hypothetical protein Tcan_05608 [Toxocara canis]